MNFWAWFTFVITYTKRTIYREALIMNIGMGIGRIAPIYSASFLPQSNNPKTKAPVSTSKPDAKQLPFSEVLSALVTADNPQLKQKLKARL